MNSLLSWIGGEAKTVAFAILSGVIGFLAKSIYDLWTARRKDKLERVNQQLKTLYGPLYALNQASNFAWQAFRSKTRPQGAFFGGASPPTASDLEAWQIWMTTVFQPLHNQMFLAITQNADLLIESDLPKPLQLFCAHVSAYQVVFDRWSRKDYSEYTSVLNYPNQELSQYLEESFKMLKSEQARLLGIRRTRT
jgi:hypothetical protein